LLAHGWWFFPGIMASSTTKTGHHDIAEMNGYPTWLPGAIKASDWLKFLMIFFSDTTWRMELKIVMNDHCKLLTKCCYFLDRLKIQDGLFNSILHVVSEKKIFEISANQRLLWPLAATLDNRSEQKVTTIDQNLVRNISAKYGSNPSSGSSIVHCCFSISQNELKF
jgi:hypothetical protein